MRETTLALTNRMGLHARAAAKLVRLAKSVESRVTVTASETGKTADAISILDLLSIAATFGTNLDIAVDGPDEVEAIRQIEELFVSRFDED